MNTKPVIRFDSSDWDSVRDMYDKLQEHGEMITGYTEDEEFMTFSVSGNTLVTKVYQHNNWIRKDIYDLDDYMIETMYERER